MTTCGSIVGMRQRPRAESSARGGRAPLTERTLRPSAARLGLAALGVGGVGLAHARDMAVIGRVERARRTACRRRARSRARSAARPRAAARRVNSTPRSWGIESKPHACTIRAPGAHGLLVVAHVHAVDELGLAGEVDVVGPGLRAGGDERLAVVAGTGRPWSTTTRADSATARSESSSVDVGVQQRRRRRRGGRAAPRAWTRLRPASAQRVPAGAWRARYSAVRPPVNPVAPKRTMSCSREEAWRSCHAVSRSGGARARRRRG